MSGEAVRERWQTALPSEVDYWQRVIGGRHPIADRSAWLRRRVAGQHEFPGHLRRYVNAGYRVLDVGSGPATTLGPLEGVEIIAIDPLAETYNSLLKEHQLEPRNPTRVGEGERLSMLGLGRFDLVYSRNALDHAYDPIQVIREMVAVCKPTGTVLFEGHVNEGAKGYTGLHQWNFMPLNNGDLVIWDRENRARSLRAALPTSRVNAHGNQWYTVVIQPYSLKRWPPWLRPLARRIIYAVIA